MFGPDFTFGPDATFGPRISDQGGPVIHEGALSFGHVLTHAYQTDAIYEPSLSFDLSAGNNYQADASLNGSALFGAILSQIQDGVIQTGPQIIDVSLTFDIGLQQSQNSIADLNAAVDYSNVLGIGAFGGTTITGELEFSINHGVAQQSDTSVEGQVTLGVHHGVLYDLQGVWNSGLLLNQVLDISETTEAILNSAISFDSIQSITTDGSKITLGIVVPSERTFLVRAEDRTFIAIKVH